MMVEFSMLGGQSKETLVSTITDWAEQMDETAW